MTGKPSYPHRHMSAQALARYTVEQQRGWPFPLYAVKAGDGERVLFVGNHDTCMHVARKLAEAFQDGAFMATQTWHDELAKLTESSSQQDNDLIQQLCDTLELAKTCHGITLLSDPPKELWKAHGVDHAINQALQAAGYNPITRQLHVAQKVQK